MQKDREVRGWVVMLRVDEMDDGGSRGYIKTP